jgi:dTDP-4-amino-4,6-dideoxygalactose transaminase
MIEYENLAKTNAAFLKVLEKDLRQTIQSGWFILGEKVSQFEKAFASFCGTRYCTGVASGLDALIIALRSFDFPPGCEIIVPSNTYIATILSIIHAGCKPVLVEPDIHTYNINPALIEGNITSRTKGVMIVHLYGKPCNMDPIMSACRKHKLHLFEDCAQAHGARYKGKIVGGFGDAGAFSFYPTKNLGALGDAGAIVTNKAALDKKFRIIRHYGQNKKYYNQLIGINSRLDEVQAGFLSIKLSQIERLTVHKRKLANIYLEQLKDDFIKPVRHPDYFDVYHIFNIRHSRRDKLRDYLLKNEIKTEIHYPVPPHEQKAMKGILMGNYPISEEIHRTTLSLPISFAHSADDIHHVVDILNKF